MAYKGGAGGGRGHSRLGSGDGRGAPRAEIVAVDDGATPTVQALGERLVRRLGDSGPLRLRVREPDSNVILELSAELTRWDLDPEAPDPIGDLGLVLFRPKAPAVAAMIEPGSPAEQADLRVGTGFSPPMVSASTTGSPGSPTSATAPDAPSPW